jgi:hypothetical protein
LFLGVFSAPADPPKKFCLTICLTFRREFCGNFAMAVPFCLVSAGLEMRRIFALAVSQGYIKTGAKASLGLPVMAGTSA